MIEYQVHKYRKGGQEPLFYVRKVDTTTHRVIETIPADPSKGTRNIETAWVIRLSVMEYDLEKGVLPEKFRVEVRGQCEYLRERLLDIFGSKHWKELLAGGTLEA